MVLKTCKICGKEFEAKGRDLCCSPECSKINNKNKNKERSKEYYANNRDKILERNKKYRENNPDKLRESKRKWCENNPDKVRESQKKYRENNRDKVRESQKKYNQSEKGKATQKKHRESDKYKEYMKKYRQSDKYREYHKKYVQKKIDDLNERFNGDLNSILEKCPTSWMEREAKMRVWFNESYSDGMVAKIESTPVCEVTGENKDLIIHHLNSFNTHPELGNDVTNMVRITDKIHNEFHNIYGRGNNTVEQWIEFIQKRVD